MKHLYVDTDNGASDHGGASAGDAMDTLANAVAKLPADLTSDDSYTIHCKGSAADTTAVVINNHTTDATHYILIQTDTADRHSGIWSTSKYRITVTSSGSPGIYVLEDYVRIDGLQINIVTPTGNYTHCIHMDGQTATNNAIYISNCILRGHASASYTGSGIMVESANANVYMWNNIIYGVGLDANNFGIATSGANQYIYNCTVIGGYIGIRCGAGTVTCKNSYAGGSAGQDLARIAGVFAKTNCASEDQSADDTGTDETATNCLAAAVAVNSTTFTDHDSDPPDYRLPGTGSALYHTGVDTDGESAPLNFTTDICGENYDTSTRSIGADEYVTASNIQGSACWGHSTDVTQQNTRTFATNWTGTAAISGSGDTEIVTFDAGEYVESEVVNTGATTWSISQNSYRAGDSVTISYKTGDSVANCEADTWHTYSGAFESSGYVKIRAEVAA